MMIQKNKQNRMGHHRYTIVKIFMFVLVMLSSGSGGGGGRSVVLYASAAGAVDDMSKEAGEGGAEHHIDVAMATTSEGEYTTYSVSNGLKRLNEIRNKYLRGQDNMKKNKEDDSELSSENPLVAVTEVKDVLKSQASFDVNVLCAVLCFLDVSNL